MDIVVPIKEATHNNYAELRFALRSFEKYIAHDDVVLIGAQPNWFKNGRTFAFRDDPDPKFREANIFLKLQWYVKNHNDGSEFVYANDDHFVLSQWDGLPPYPTKGTLANALASRNDLDPYKKTIGNTINLLGHQAFNYDVHAPMSMHPKVFADKFFEKEESLPNKIVWKGKQWGYLLKSLYGQGFQQYDAQDFKINEPIQGGVDFFVNSLSALTGLEYFSTSDKAFDMNMVDALLTLFPNPSRYELA